MHSNPALNEKSPLRTPFPRMSIGKSTNPLRHSGMFHRNAHHEDSIIRTTSLINTENKNSHNHSNDQSFDDSNFKFPDFYEIDFIEQEAKDDIMYSLYPSNIMHNINADNNKVNVTLRNVHLQLALR